MGRQRPTETRRRLDEGCELCDTAGMANFGQIPLEQAKAGAAAWRMKEKPTSEQIRQEAEQLRATATKLMDHAKILIKRSAELEKLIAGRNGAKPSTDV